MRSTVALALLIVSTLHGLTGCTLTPDRRALVPETYQIKVRHSGAVRIVVDGGREASFMAGPWISNEVFSGALEDAIDKSGLFTRVVKGSDAVFRVEVVLQRLLRPAGGGAMEAQLSALWVLRTVNPERVVWQDLIATTGVTSAFESFSGITRITMAIERAGKKNIQRGVQEMSLLELGGSDDPK